MTKSIFVVGVPRSGTTWLANFISSHSEVAAVLRNDAGVAESAFFSRIAWIFGDIAKTNNFIQMVEIFSKSTFFELSCLDKEFLYRERARTYAEFFQMVMDRIAADKGKTFWLDKTPQHARYLETIANAYSDAKFVAIERNIVDQIRSAVKLRERISKSALVSFKRISIIVMLIWRYYSYHKHIVHFREKYPDRIMVITYEMLFKHPKDVLSSISAFLRIEFEDHMLKTQFKQISSFRSQSERKQTLSAMEIKLIGLLSPFCELCPYLFYRFFFLVHCKFSKKLPFWFFSKI